MANDTSIIKEFLVALGFKSDEAALKKFQGGIDQATKAVFSLAAAVEGTAVAVATGVARFANNLEQLYFASIKTGTSATNLRAFDRAARDLGAGAGEAQESVQGLARFLRNNPGGEGALAAWFGVNVKDANGNPRMLTDVLLDIGKAMQKMPQWRQQQLGGMIGLSEDTIRVLANGEFAANYARIQKEFEKGGMDKAAQDAHKFMESLRDLGDQLMLFGLQIYEALQTKFKVSLDTITAWMQANGPELAKKVADILSQIVDWANKLIDVSIKIYDWFKKLDAQTDGWSTKLLGLLAVMKLLGATEIIGGVLSLAAAFIRLGASITGAGAALTTAGGARLLPLLGRLGGAAGLGVGAGYLLDKYFPNNWLARAGNFLGGSFFEQLHKKDTAIEMLTNMGWSRPQAEGIVNVLNAESGLNPHEVGDNGLAYGIGQWHPDRQARFKEFAGHDIRESTGDTSKDLAEQLAFIRWEMQHYEKDAFEGVRGVTNEADFRELFTAMYERPKNPDWETVRASPNLHIDTDININGVKEDPAALARFIQLEQSRVNEAIVREFAPVVQ